MIGRALEALLFSEASSVVAALSRLPAVLNASAKAVDAAVCFVEVGVLI